MWLNWLCLVVYCISYTTQEIQTFPKYLGHMTSMAKVPAFPVQYSTFRNVYWVLELPVWQNVGMRHPAAATFLAWCIEEYLTTVIAYLPENGGSTRVSTDLQVHKARWTGFKQ
jgi:hypothetical protein